MHNKSFLLAGALIVVLGTSRLVAQNVDGPEEAGKEFLAYLSRQDFDSLQNLVSQDSFRRLGDDGVRALLRDLRLVPDKWEAKAEDNGQASVTPIFEPRTVICRKDGLFWRVDLIATASQWWKQGSAEGARKVIRDYSVLPQFGEASQALCLSNLKSIAVALRQYQEDNKDFFPPADRWNDSLMPYLTSEAALHCPAAGKRNYGYAMNGKLSSRAHKDVKSPNGAPIAIFYEATKLERNATGDGRDLSFRHENKQHIIFSDGSVRVVSQGQKLQFSILTNN